MYRSSIIALLFFILLNSNISYAQEIDSLSVKEKLRPSLSPKDPLKALTLSAVVPGVGQVYAESYFHGTVFFSLNAYLIYKIVSKQMESSDYHDQWKQDPDNEELEQKYLDSFESRNMHIWLWAFTYILNLMDAYVEATLYNFDERINLKVSSDYILNRDELVPALTLTLNFDIR